MTDPHEKSVGEYSHNRSPLLVTGANGQLGREVLWWAAAAGVPAIGVDRAVINIQDANRMTGLVQQIGPAAIIHCAAFTMVDDAQSHRTLAFAVNETGTKNVVSAARNVGAHVITVSTDYVFDGTRSEGYCETDVPSPINVYGESKLAAETATLAYERGCVARTAWLFGKSGNNFVRTIERLAGKLDVLEVVNDQTGCPTFAGHLGRALVDCALNKIVGVVHLVDSPQATWFDVAEVVVKEIGSSAQVTPVSSEQFVRPAPRPTCSILRSTRVDAPAMGDWREGVAAVFATDHSVR